MGSRVFTLRAPEAHHRESSGSSRGLRLPFRGCPSTEPPHRTPGCPGVRHTVPPACLFCSASLEVSTPSAFPRSEQRHELVEPTSPDRLRLQVLATSWRLHPPRACRPCFMPDPLLGSPFRAFSSRAAVRRLRRHSPLGVRSAFRVLLRARVRLSIQGFSLESSAWLSWVFSLPRLSLHQRWSGLHRPSPRAVDPLRPKRLSGLHSRVSHVGGLAGLSRDCRPS